MGLNPDEITREAVARQLVTKHEKALKVTTEEFEKYQKLETEQDKAAENFKTDRDKFNEMVQEHKSNRQKSYSESKELRKQFMAKLNKKKSMEHIPMEVLILTKQIDQLEWEIQTEAVNVDSEKRLVKQIQGNIEKLHNYANMYKDHEDVSKAVRSLTSELSKKLNFAEDEHQEMIKAVEKSDQYHKNFVESVMNLRDARTKRIAFQRDVEKHKKAIGHWQAVAEKEAKKKPVQSPKSKPRSDSKSPGTDGDSKPDDEAKEVKPEKNQKIAEDSTTEKASVQEAKPTPEPEKAKDPDPSETKNNKEVTGDGQ